MHCKLLAMHRTQRALDTQNKPGITETFMLQKGINWIKCGSQKKLEDASWYGSQNFKILALRTTS